MLNLFHLKKAHNIRMSMHIRLTGGLSMTDNNQYRIIVIDDNQSIHKDFIKILAANTPPELDDISSKLFGKSTPDTELPLFEITTATQGQEGAKLVKEAFEENKPFALAFVDTRMPPG